MCVVLSAGTHDALSLAPCICIKDVKQPHLDEKTKPPVYTLVETESCSFKSFPNFCKADTTPSLCLNFFPHFHVSMMYFLEC